MALNQHYWYKFTMNWQDDRWQAPLATRPKLVSVGSNNFKPGQIGRWRALNFWCFNLYRYEADLWVEGKHYPIREGRVSLVPPLLEMEYHFKTNAPQTHAHHIYPEATAKTPLTAVPVVIDLGREFDRVYRSIEELVGWYSLNRTRAEVRLWEVLWELAERAGPVAAGPESIHPALARALGSIERNLSQPLRVEALAEEAGISQNHLTRLFQARFKTSVVGYIRRLRTERARHLLMHSTQTVKSIAAQVGIPDLHLFNKVMRRELGRSPRALRTSKEN